MRVLVEGRTVRDERDDREEKLRVTFKVETRRVAILPYRIEAVALDTRPRTISGLGSIKKTGASISNLPSRRLLYMLLLISLQNHEAWSNKFSPWWSSEGCRA